MDKVINLADYRKSRLSADQPDQHAWAGWEPCLYQPHEFCRSILAGAVFTIFIIGTCYLLTGGA